MYGAGAACNRRGASRPTPNAPAVATNAVRHHASHVRSAAISTFSAVSASAGSGVRSATAPDTRRPRRAGARPVAAVEQPPDHAAPTMTGSKNAPHERCATSSGMDRRFARKALVGDGAGVGGSGSARARRPSAADELRVSRPVAPFMGAGSASAMQPRHGAAACEQLQRRGRWTPSCRSAAATDSGSRRRRWRSVLRRAR